MVVTLLGISMRVKAEQFSKALYSMVLRPSGKTISCKFLQYWKVFS